ncbi:Uncharacterised protein [Salmonella enterica subsp. enterica serovar Typhi]|nr:Uncharacterised protein [Salmonella enterica subsp. enterica serovar Typhi]CHD48531.1 Uncharacterised protein [Salmonella enterica subsp. enterica serovar Typhi]CHG42792.1 Uncharacterised protein [Salmonella enterica subsp. enterica serovar Typhi]CHL17996.1 Uncharacterised protein [Salmonella enterica subsp. enterica serovar Typhi]CIH34368.1 Uncharacterised protein [Salmonella enterica subsp. enterica serovar Typhi]
MTVPVEPVPLMVEVPVFLIVALSPSMMMAVPPPLTAMSPAKLVVVPLPEISAPVALSTVEWPEMVLVVPSPVITMPMAPSVTLEPPVSVLTVRLPEIITPVRSWPLISMPRSEVCDSPSPLITVVLSSARIR